MSATRRRFLGTSATVAGGMLLSGQGAASVKLEPLARRALGRTGVSLPILGLGAACFGQCRTVSAEEATAVCHEALELGIDFFDVARAYGKAEEVIGRFLQGRRDQVFLTTKAGGSRAADLDASFETSLRLLRTDHVDLLYWHGMGGRIWRRRRNRTGPSPGSRRRRRRAGPASWASPATPIPPRWPGPSGAAWPTW